MNENCKCYKHYEGEEHGIINTHVREIRFSQSGCRGTGAWTEIHLASLKLFAHL